MRRYGQWAGNERGAPEDPARCLAEVPFGGRSPLFHQCFHKRGRGPGGEYCGQHARMLERGLYVNVPEDEPDKEVRK